MQILNPLSFLTSTLHIAADNIGAQNLAPANCNDIMPELTNAYLLDNMPYSEKRNAELSLLDLYSGCGGMSTGLCLGTKVSCVDLVTVLKIEKS